jgi:hypothetical protein
MRYLVAAHGYEKGHTGRVVASDNIPIAVAVASDMAAKDYS